MYTLLLHSPYHSLLPLRNVYPQCVKKPSEQPICLLQIAYIHSPLFSLPSNSSALSPPWSLSETHIRYVWNTHRNRPSVWCETRQRKNVQEEKAILLTGIKANRLYTGRKKGRGHLIKSALGWLDTTRFVVVKKHAPVTFSRSRCYRKPLRNTIWDPRPDFIHVQRTV